MERDVAQSESEQGSLPFVWPPRRDGAKPGSMIEPKPGAFVPGGGTPIAKRFQKLSWFEEIEEALLGTRARVLSGRDGRWEPEPMERACPRCGRGVGEGEVSPEDGRCIGCRPERLGWERLVRLGPHAGLLREAILATKFEGWRRQGAELGRMLGERLGGALDEANIDRTRAVLVPVPMPTFRRLGRGIDHTLTIARGVSRETGIGIERSLVKLAGRPQVRVALSERAMNVQGRVRVGLPPRRVPEVVVLVDDVKTTGATLRACSRAIQGAAWGKDCRVWGAVVSVATEAGRRESGVGSAPEFHIPA